MQQYDPEFAEAIALLLPFLQKAPRPPIGDFVTRRNGTDAAWAGFMEAWPAVEDVTHQTHELVAEDGASIRVHHFSKNTGIKGHQPTAAVVYCHGGGYFCLSADLYSRIMATYASGSGAQIFGVEYRMAPEHAYPLPLQDCWSTLKWVSQQGAELGVDPTRIAVMGDSAGGGLAAGLAIMARDQGLEPPLAKQILIAAMLDNSEKEISSELARVVTWNIEDNITGWNCYLGKDATRSSYAVPARLSDVKGLPPIYMDVSDLDLFRDENLLYASRIAAVGISTELHLWPGLPHCFEVLAPRSGAATKALTARIEALCRV